MYNYKTVREHIEQYLQNSFSTQLYLRKNLANVLICKQLYWVIHNRGKIDIFDSIICTVFYRYAYTVGLTCLLFPEHQLPYAVYMLLSDEC